MRTYPYYGKYAAGEKVVYFVSKDTGTVVKGDRYHSEGEHRTDWYEEAFIKTKFEGESQMARLKKGDLIVGSQNKATGAVSVAAHPKVQPNFIAAQTEAERLANTDKTKKFVVLEVKGVVTVGDTVWE